MADAPPPYTTVSTTTSSYGAQPPPPGFVGPPAGAAPYPQPYPQPYPPGGADGKGQYMGTPGGYPVNYQLPPAGQVTSGSTTVIVPAQSAQPVVMIRGGNCPRCLTGVIVEDFTCCGIFLAIFFFPLGLLCCLLLRQRYCNRCHYSM